MGGAGRKVGTFATLVLAAGLLVLAPSAPAVADGNEAPGAPEAFRSIVAGTGHTCALDVEGDVRCWGRNDTGQLGLGDTVNRGDGPGEMGDALPAVDLGVGRTATAITAGTTHTCALLDDGQVKCWGSGGTGHLGLGDLAHRGDGPDEMGDHLPEVQLGTGRTATAIAGGNFQTCALLDDGQVKCWGSNAYGQLGQGDTVARGDGPDEMGDHLPEVQLGTGRTATAISAGELSVCALLDNGQVKCWGNNESGQLGYGDTANRGDGANEMGNALAPVDLGTDRTATAISVGQFHACALLDDGQVKCWGRNNEGEAGVGDTQSRGDGPGEMGDDLPAASLGTGVTATSVTAGDVHTCAALAGGQIKCWGGNLYGQLGRGDTQARGDAAGEMGDSLPAIDVGTGRTVAAVTSGGITTCALLDNDQVKCWGANFSGELGLGDTARRGNDPGEMGDALPAAFLRPPNDDFADATVLAGGAGSIRASNANAANEAGEPLHDSDAASDVTVWWSWTAPTTGAIRFNTAGSSFDTILAVYTGTAVDDLTSITSNDDTDTSMQSQVDFPTTAGTTYRIAVAGLGPTGSGRIRLNWLPNDDVAGATVLTGATGTTNGANFGASLEPDEPDHNPNPAHGPAASVWYQWTPTAGGRVRFDTFGSAIDTVLAAYTGASVDALTSIAANDDTDGVQSRIVFTATAGTTYRIALAAFDTADPIFGTTTLHWTQAGPCDGRPVTVARAFGDLPTAGADVIRGTGGNDTINGLGGADRICGGNGTDTLRGGTGAGNDRLFGENGTDTLRGGSGNDALDGGAANDQLLGEAGADRLNGGANRDTCNGGPQRDTQTGCEVRTSVP